MANNITPLEQLKEFLNQLFQFETQDLDFGVYKILHYKRKEIKLFIDDLLVKKVKEQLQTLADAQVKDIITQLEKLERSGLIKAWLYGDKDVRRTIEQSPANDEIAAYKELRAKAEEPQVSEETENLIYNHLTLFFSRYYDKGDFISKRRFGKNEKYVVPYNGEETHFYWANHDQYYIKSSETFQQYSFKVATHKGKLTVNFKLHNAHLEQGNVKADEKNFFLLAEQEPEIKENGKDELNFVLANKTPDISDHEVTFYFEYRPLADEEKNKVKGNNKQDTLDKMAYQFINEQFKTNPLLANLWKEEDCKPLLLKKLNHYTRKNKYDFFIHKNLKGFLQRELDYYIKSELVSVDDLYVADSDEHLDRLKHNLKTIKVFKVIADTIIDFVSQIEDFQKKLWEKKKFVLSTEWVITIDRLVEYLGEDSAKPILEEVIQNKKQVSEWKKLFGEENVPNGDIKIDSLKTDLVTWRKLPIDTSYFGKKFKEGLLSKVSETQEIEKVIDGSIISSNNFHGNSHFASKYANEINCIYADPPYNTSENTFVYKNTFKHSSWISMIAESISMAKRAISEDGVLCIAIDDTETFNLRFLLNQLFSQENFISTIGIEVNPAGQNIRPNVPALSHDYCHVYAKNIENVEMKLRGLTPEEKKLYKEKDDDGFYLWDNLRRRGGNSRPTDRPKQWFPLYADIKTKKVSIEPFDGSVECWPIDPQNEQRIWRVNIDGAKRFIKSGDISVIEKAGRIEIVKKTRMPDGKKPKTLWYDSKYSATTHGTKLLINILGRQVFSYPKSIYLVLDTLRHWTNTDSNIMDYFAGSGTTFHATQLLNKEDDGKRKCILIEQGDYVYTVIIPRMKKIAYSFDWKNSKPKDGGMNGVGIFFKYQRLEQYEEALENIAFNVSEDAAQKALDFEQYIPKYFLEFETRGSQTLVNTAAMQDPWDYKLKVWDGFTYDTEQPVDLVETFNYLIGLHMQKCFTKEINDKKYCFVYGKNNASKQILVVWRSIKDWSLDDFKTDGEALKKELSKYTYDLLYINGQAHIENYQPIEEVFKNKMLPQ